MLGFVGSLRSQYRAWIERLPGVENQTLRIVNCRLLVGFNLNGCASDRIHLSKTIKYNMQSDPLSWILECAFHSVCVRFCVRVKIQSNRTLMRFQRKRIYLIWLCRNANAIQQEVYYLFVCSFLRWKKFQTIIDLFENTFPPANKNPTFVVF